MEDSRPGPERSRSLYERFLAGAAGAALPPSRPSASVVPWRRAGKAGVEVFWVRRAEALQFMGGWHAFPGGGLSRGDAEVPVAGAPRGPGEGRAAGLPDSLRDLDGEEGPGPDVVPGLVAAALRELFEETGLLLARPVARPEGRGEASNPVLAGDLEPHRRALEARQTTFAALLAGLGLEADASRLVYAGRWLTPPFTPLRFDNRFFLLEWPREEPVQPAVLPGELAGGEWIAPAEALARWERGEVLAAPPILHLLQVLAEEGPEAGLPRLVDPSETNLGPFRRIELRPGVLLFPLATRTLPPAATTNAYLLGLGEALLVDPGSTSEVELGRLERALQTAGERLARRVTAIALTHHHPDHVGGVKRLASALGVPVLAHRATAERLAPYGIRVDREVADGERLRLGAGPHGPAMTVRAVHTPGHARGHLCFLDEERGSLLAGDMVAGIGTIVVDPPEGDMDDYLASLEKLAALAPRTLFPSHGPPIQHAVAKLREYVEHRLWREERILAAAREGKSAAEMIPTVYDDVPEAAWPLAERQILAHLARLRRAGRLPG